ncbi:ABC transporter permease [Thermocrinis sp.]
MKISPLYLVAFGVVLVPATPSLFTVFSALTSDLELWRRLYETRLSVILPNTLKLLLSVGILCLFLGISSAWMVSRFDFYGRRLWEILLILPLAVPGYIMAYAYASFMAPGGPAQDFWRLLFEDLSMPSLYSFWGVSLVLSFVNYPYVYLLTRAGLLNSNLRYQEVARSLGVSPFVRFLSIELKLLYPSIMAGLILALMEVMADFGTVALLRYPTFTEAIYRQITGRFDILGGTALASALLTLSFLMLNLEMYFKGKRSFEQIKGGYRTIQPRKLGLLGTLLANIFLFTIVCFAFLIPIGVILQMAYKALSQIGLEREMFRYALNSLLVSAIGATLATFLAFSPAYLHSRSPNPISKGLYYISSLGYSLPGPVVAVGLLLVATTTLKWAYGSLALLVLAYVARFMPVALQSQHSSLAMLSRSLEDASRTLGAGNWRTYREVVLPNIKSGLMVGWIIVFVDCMKELPATIMLRPLGFDTLAVRVWIDASESLWNMASVPALLIVLTGLLPLAIIIREISRRRDLEVA